MKFQTLSLHVTMLQGTASTIPVLPFLEMLLSGSASHSKSLPLTFVKTCQRILRASFDNVSALLRIALFRSTTILFRYALTTFEILIMTAYIVAFI